MTGEARSFNALARDRWASGRHLCIGLDTDVARIPDSVAPSLDGAMRIVRFNERIVDATADIAAAFKPNIAFYEAVGAPGIEALAATIGHIKSVAPEVPIIVDAKRADIGNTNIGYVRAIYDELGADAVTVHPYLGATALRPFLDRPEKQVFVLTRTSNDGAGELQDLVVDGGVPLYRAVARTVARSWNHNGNCGLVVGATYPDELALVREDAGPQLPILVPGVGAQGGDLEASVRASSANGSRAFLVNASRSILYASATDDFQAAARAEAQRLDQAIRGARSE